MSWLALTVVAVVSGFSGGALLAWACLAGLAADTQKSRAPVPILAILRWSWIAWMAWRGKLAGIDTAAREALEEARRDLDTDRAALAAEREELRALGADFDGAWARAKDLLRSGGPDALVARLAIQRTDRGVHLRAIARFLAAFDADDDRETLAAVAVLRGNLALLAEARAAHAAREARAAMLAAEDDS